MNAVVAVSCGGALPAFPADVSTAAGDLRAATVSKALHALRSVPDDHSGTLLQGSVVYFYMEETFTSGSRESHGGLFSFGTQHLN